jgi:hypothetical protein
VSSSFFDIFQIFFAVLAALRLCGRSGAGFPQRRKVRKEDAKIDSGIVDNGR